MTGGEGTRSKRRASNRFVLGEVGRVEAVVAFHVGMGAIDDVVSAEKTRREVGRTAVARRTGQGRGPARAEGREGGHEPARLLQVTGDNIAGEELVHGPGGEESREVDEVTGRLSDLEIGRSWKAALGCQPRTADNASFKQNCCRSQTTPATAAASKAPSAETVEWRLHLLLLVVREKDSCWGCAQCFRPFSCRCFRAPRAVSTTFVCCRCLSHSPSFEKK